MPTHERFSRFLFGALLIGAFVVPWGKWVALLIGILFVASSLNGLCVGCKCKEALNKTVNKQEEV